MIGLDFCKFRLVGWDHRRKGVRRSLNVWGRDNEVLGPDRAEGWGEGTENRGLEGKREMDVGARDGEGKWHRGTEVG